jgi:hypothetical protein
VLVGEGSGEGFVEVQVMGIGGRRGIKESRKELNLLQTPLHHATPLFNFIMPSGPIVFLSRGHVGRLFDSSYQVWTEKFTIVGGVSYLRYHRVQSLLLGVMSSKSALNLMSKILRMK